MSSKFNIKDKIPKSIFKGLPTDKLAPVDSSKVTEDVKPVNNYKRKTVEGIDQLKKAVPTLESVMKDDELAESTKKALSGINNKLKESGAYDKLNLPKMPEGLKGALEKKDSIIATTKETINKGKELVAIGKGYYEVGKDYYNKAMALKETYDLLTDKAFWRDIGKNIGETIKGTLTTIAVDMAGEVGAGDLARLFIDRLDQPKQKKEAWGQAAYSYSYSSSLDTIYEAIENGGLDNFYALTDDPIGHVLYNFRFNESLYPDPVENGNALIRVLKKIDPKWDHYIRDGEKVYKLCSFKKASDDAMLVFDSIDELRPVARSAKEIGTLRSREVIARTYPVLKELMSYS